MSVSIKPVYGWLIYPTVISIATGYWLRSTRSSRNRTYYDTIEEIAIFILCIFMAIPFDIVYGTAFGFGIYNWYNFAFIVISIYGVFVGYGKDAT